MKKLNLIGERFSRLTVIRAAPTRGYVGGGKLSFWVCRCDCGVETEVGLPNLRQGHTRSCGCLSRETRIALNPRGEEHPNWRGGRYQDKEGYIRLKRPPSFPGNENRHRLWAYEHLVRMAQHLRRPLHRDETVHHKNGIRDDNDIENLELRASAHGRGQRPADLVGWAKEILARYSEPIISPCCV